MKHILPLLVCLLFGMGVGWYLGYSRPVAKHQRELLKEYQDVKNDVHMTDEEMAAMGRKLPEYFGDVKRQDETAAAVALSAFQYLQRGETDTARDQLRKTIGTYYVLYREKGGDAELLAKIEAAAREYPSLADEISPKAE